MNFFFFKLSGCVYFKMSSKEPLLERALGGLCHRLQNPLSLF